LSEVVVTARKWGNSIGITLPKEMVEKEKIRENDKIVVEIKKVSSLKALFGTMKSKKSTQQIKDEMRKGWD